jgi:putative membrane protein insertion efficiency factor
MLAQVAEKLLLGLVMVYRITISPLLGPKCRFVPSCSEYAVEAIQTHGPWKGGWFTLKRLAKCHPFGPHGLDNVPPKCSDDASVPPN